SGKVWAKRESSVSVMVSTALWAGIITDICMPRALRKKSVVCCQLGIDGLILWCNMYPIEFLGSFSGCSGHHPTSRRILRQGQEGIEECLRIIIFDQNCFWPWEVGLHRWQRC